MRPCTPASLCLAASAALLSAAGPAYSGPAADCAPSAGSEFPITTRIHSAPGTYDAGGGYGTWSIDLTNTTARSCAGIHPVVVLVDERRALAPTQPKLEFYEGAHPHPVRFERTDEDELVGVFDDGFPGFTVAPGRTLTVRVRLALTSDAVPNEITANAAVVQRRDSDGDWVGQSNDYRFRVEAAPDPDPGTAAPRETEAPPGTPTSPGTDTAPDIGTTPHPSTAPPHLTTPSPAATPAPDGRQSLAEELAGTGRTSPHLALTAVAALLVACGGALVFVGRRR
ncbi:hypothetical protein ADL00_38900 [Streptomyces sp. AS58]|uniref:hypothetical protein n=1 Tax=Streptomyces sp. AS58 TaxID=1519489 RepID=UPI0006B0255A|nr:hypothetical protein [Streptomyces sp. AS58]KOV51922.1 hypothetical protein ADL00_38900 [Streptomyces sp. AS58]